MEHNINDLFYLLLPVTSSTTFFVNFRLICKFICSNASNIFFVHFYRTLCQAFAGQL